MAKNKNNKYMNNNQDKKDQVERLKIEKMKAKEKAEEQKKQQLIETMDEEEAKLFMSQEEILKREAEADKREKELKEKQEKIQEELNKLEERKKAVAEQELSSKDKLDEVVLKEKELKKEKTAFEKKKIELLNKERSLIERENNAENEFALQNQRALEVLRDRQEKLEKDIANLEKQKLDKEENIINEVQQFREKKMRNMEDEIAALYESRKKELDSKLKQIEEAGKEQIAHELKLVEDQKEAVRTTQKDLNKEKMELEVKQRNLDSEQDNVRFERRMLEEEKKTNQRVIAQKVEQGIESIKYDLERAEKDVSYYKRKLEVYEEKVTEYERQEREADGHSIEELISINESLQRDVERLRREKAELPNQSLFIEYQSKAEGYDELQRELNNTRRELYDLLNKAHQWEKTTNLLQIEREKCDHYERMGEIYQEQLKKYKEEVNRYKSLYEQPKVFSERLKTINEPFLKKKDVAILEISEKEWLDKIYAKCEDSGIKFNKRLLYSFHTALKTANWSPLTVLAGVSGTGKSLLPEYYCRYGGIYFMAMAVQPDWDSSQALFGYFNAVDNRYNATTLIRSLVQFSTSDEERAKESNLSDTMFLVLLDEMNLAHVELYFSDMLSKLERRRNTNDNVGVEIDLGAEMPKYLLELNDNVLWVGTMNEDETTKSLSDKVLDRGNLISFPRPKEFISRTKTQSMEETPMLRKSVWNSWIEMSVTENEEFQKLIKKYKEGLEKVNEAMEFAGRALGHRVWQSIENYMGNHPNVITAFTAEKIDQAECNKCLTEAFEEALVHKVMPKLRGIETDGETKTRCIDRIKDILFGAKGLAPGLETDFENAINSAYETFLWNSAKYLEIEG